MSEFDKGRHARFLLDKRIRAWEKGTEPFNAVEAVADAVIGAELARIIVEDVEMPPDLRAAIRESIEEQWKAEGVSS